MFIFAPVPSPGPTSWNNNGCQVEFGGDRIKLSPPLWCVNLLLQTFSYLIHFHPLRCGCTKFSGSAGPSGPGVWILGTRKWLSSQHTRRYDPRRVQLCSPPEQGIAVAPGACADPGTRLRCDPSPQKRGFLVNKKGNCAAAPAPSARRL